MRVKRSLISGSSAEIPKLGKHSSNKSIRRELFNIFFNVFTYLHRPRCSLNFVLLNFFLMLSDSIHNRFNRSICCLYSCWRGLVKQNIKYNTKDEKTDAPP